jgi:hypothetical protein
VDLGEISKVISHHVETKAQMIRPGVKYSIRARSWEDGEGKRNESGGSQRRKRKEGRAIGGALGLEEDEWGRNGISGKMKGRGMGSGGG